MESKLPITQGQWNRKIGRGEHEIIFGITYRESEDDYPRVVSVKSDPGGNHGRFFGRKYERYDVVTWRYSVLTKTNFWWSDWDQDEKQATTDHLKDKYNETPLYNRRMDWHGPEDLEGHMLNTAALKITHNDSPIQRWKTNRAGRDRTIPNKMPTFKQWLALQRDGD